jgi:hypothetical protein
MAERHRLMRRFLKGLRIESNRATSLIFNKAILRENQLQASAGKPGIKFRYKIRQHDARVDLTIDRPKGSENAALLQELREHQRRIQTSFREPTLKFEEKRGRRVRFVYVDLPGGGWQDTGQWESTQRRMLSAMKRFERALRPHINRLSE